MKVKMLSTQQYAATGTTYEQGQEYDVTPEQAGGFVNSGVAVAVDSPKPVPNKPEPPIERVHPDTSKPLSTVEARTISDEEAVRAGYPAKGVDEIPVFPPKMVTFKIPQRPTGVGPAHVGGMQVANTRPQTAFLKHHESVVDILKFLRQPTDGSVLIMKPDSEAPFALEDYPYAEVVAGDVLEVVNYVRPVNQADSTAVLTPSGHVASRE